MLFLSSGATDPSRSQQSHRIEVADMLLKTILFSFIVLFLRRLTMLNEEAIDEPQCEEELKSIIENHINNRTFNLYCVILSDKSDKSVMNAVKEYGDILAKIAGKYCCLLYFRKSKDANDSKKAHEFYDRRGLLNYPIADLFEVNYSDFPCLLFFNNTGSKNIIVSLQDISEELIVERFRRIFDHLRGADDMFARLALYQDAKMGGVSKAPSLPRREVSPVPADGTEGPVRLFCSYSHRDERYRQALEQYLTTLRREGYISDWSDRQISPGQEWDTAIQENLETADIILLLVSQDFLASPYAYEKEMLRAIERHDKGEARVIPVIVRPSDWKHPPLAKLQALPRNGRPVSRWDSRDEAWLAVADGIRKVVHELRIARQ